MISLNFNLCNPFSKRWECLSNPIYEISKHKTIELQFDKNSDIIGFQFRFTTRQGHAGVFMSVSLLGYEAMFHFYDTRHWDYDNNCWYDYEKDNRS